MKEIRLLAGEDLDDAVKKLLVFKNKGMSVYCNFNGTYLYSDTVTLDSAYIQVCGCTKKIYDEMLKKDIAYSKRINELEKKLAIYELDDKFENSKHLVYPFRHDEWYKTLKTDAEGLYTGIITKNAIEIMNGIEENKPIDELIKVFFDQGHSGASAYWARYFIMKFSKNGYPFYNATHYGKWELDECEDILNILQENEANADELCYVDEVSKSKKSVKARQRRLTNNN